MSKDTGSNKKILQIPEKGPNETELTNLPEREFKIKIINMLMEVQKNIQELRNEFLSQRFNH